MVFFVFLFISIFRTKIITLQNTFVNKFPTCNVLSLGTSNDFEESILAASTMIRIGESLLGRRS